MGSKRPVVIVVVIALLIALGASLKFGRPWLDRRQDVAARRSVYDAFPVFPGAVKASEDSYEIRGDGRGTGDYGLTVVYRLPPTATSSEVIGFLRQNIPAGWEEASDETCARSASRYAAPSPVPTMPDGSPSPAPASVPATVLISRGSQLTVFTADRDRDAGKLRSDGNVAAQDGLTFTLSGGGGEGKWLTLNEPTYGCQAAISRTSTRSPSVSIPARSCCRGDRSYVPLEVGRT